MILRDEHGEVEVRIGDQFEVKGCTLSVICPDFMQVPSPVWVRLKSGVLILEDGRRFEVKPDAPEELPEPVFLFSADLIARCIREHRLALPAAGSRPTVGTEAHRRAPASKKRAQQNRPTSESLF